MGPQINHENADHEREKEEKTSTSNLQHKASHSNYTINNNFILLMNENQKEQPKIIFKLKAY